MTPSLGLMLEVGQGAQGSERVELRWEARPARDLLCELLAAIGQVGEVKQGEEPNTCSSGQGSFILRRKSVQLCLTGSIPGGRKMFWGKVLAIIFLHLWGPYFSEHFTVH